MRTSVATDGRGRQFLVRSGTGVVTAVIPVGSGPEPDATFSRVELHCDVPQGRPGAITYSAHPLVATGQPLHRAALEALEMVCPVIWTVQWHRHDWIPCDLPITSLNLGTDARGLLAGLDRVDGPQPVDVGMPGFVPVQWRDARR